MTTPQSRIADRRGVKMIKVMIATSNMGLLEAEAEQIGPLCIHREPPFRPHGPWVITHIATGLKLPGIRFRTKTRAQDCARSLMHDPAWALIKRNSQEPADITIPPKVKALLGARVAEAFAKFGEKL